MMNQEQINKMQEKASKTENPVLKKAIEDKLKQTTKQ